MKALVKWLIIDTNKIYGPQINFACLCDRGFFYPATLLFRERVYLPPSCDNTINQLLLLFANTFGMRRDVTGSDAPGLDMTTSAFLILSIFCPIFLLLRLPHGRRCAIFSLKPVGNRTGHSHLRSIFDANCLFEANEGTHSSVRMRICSL